MLNSVSYYKNSYQNHNETLGGWPESRQASGIGKELEKVDSHALLAGM